MQRLGHGLAPGQAGLHPVGAQGGRVLTRGEARGRLEDPVHMPGAEAGLVGQHRQGGWGFGLLQMAAQGGDQCRVAFGQGRLVWLAAPTGAEPGRLGLGEGGKEADVFGAGVPGTAGGAAVHPGGAHRIEEVAVGLAIPGKNGRPARVGHYKGSAVGGGDGR